MALTVITLAISKEYSWGINIFTFKRKSPLIQYIVNTLFSGEAAFVYQTSNKNNRKSYLAAFVNGEYVLEI